MALIAGGIVGAAQQQVAWAIRELAHADWCASVGHDRQAATCALSVAERAEHGTSLLPCVHAAALGQAADYLTRHPILLGGSARILIRHELDKLRADACWYKPKLED